METPPYQLDNYKGRGGGKDKVRARLLSGVSSEKAEKKVNSKTGSINDDTEEFKSEDEESEIDQQFETSS